MISHFVVLLLTIIKAGCVLNSTRTVKLSSKNLMTFLTWEPATGSSSETLYQVEYKLYDDSRWIQKKECWNITMVQCDLTKDIAHVTQRMSGQVRAISHGTVSDWAEAKMSIPHSDMTIDPPIFNLVPETNSMQIWISHAQDTPHDYESAKRETCAFTETGKSVHRPPAALPLNLVCVVSRDTPRNSPVQQLRLMSHTE
ncbi:hypothetical protein SKAU_G00339980 [Synaphobranchus kaupii]|uniref:Fibronectin type-III domain-containing protein n=1 Tax=Synaphobranchus kaupii TaxID=118154 RepID=A0A9Q1EMZ3_SYNKA|nr:hypothetical protein SKAU_G00339980 [Synaphobranchus kaupii]